jgi:hypothetical protein
VVAKSVIDAGRIRAAARGVVALAALLAARPAAAYLDGDNRLEEHTAFTPRARQMEVGVLALDVGLFDRLSVGTATLPWLVGAWRSTWAPNLHLKVALLQSRYLSLAAKGGLAYLRLGTGERGALAHLFAVPVSLYASVDFLPAWSLHLEGSFIAMRGVGTVSVGTLDLDGAAAGRAVQAGAMLEWRLGRTAALTLRGRLQPEARPVRVVAKSAPDDFTHAAFEADVTARETRQSWAAVAGVALSWQRLNLRLGVGYGTVFSGAYGLPLTEPGLWPDGNLFFRF